MNKRVVSFLAKEYEKTGLSPEEALRKARNELYVKGTFQAGAMEGLGVSVIEYEAGNNQARVDALNSLDGLKFHLKDGKIEQNKNTAELGGVTNWSAKSIPQNPDSAIAVDMDEKTRYSILKDKKIQPQEITIAEDIDIEFLENNIKSIVEKPLIKKLNELGCCTNENRSRGRG